jgi:hypothetical protein
MAPAVCDFVKLFEGIPEGAWVAISQTQDCVVAYAAELNDALSKAREQGEPNPIIIRVPQSSVALVL